MEGDIVEEKKKSPREGANIFNVISYKWMTDIFRLGYKRELEFDDLYEPLKEHKSNIISDELSNVWKNELERCSKKCNNKSNYPSLLRVLIKVFGLRFMSYGLVALILEIITRVIEPLILGRFMRYFTDSSIKINEAYFYAFGIAATTLTNIFLDSFTWMVILHIGMKMRISCCSLIYRKSLKLSKVTLDEKTIGQAVNLLSNDVSRFDTSLLDLHYLWLAPLQTIVATYFMYREGGLPAICGVFVLLAFVPIQGWLGHQLTVLRMRTAVKTDERVRATNEIIRGIQVIKMFTWEDLFKNKIKSARNHEIKLIRYSSYIKSIFMSLAMFVSKLALFVAILTYILIGDDITADKVFMLIAFYANLQHTVTSFFPLGVTQISELIGTIKRLQQFMMYSEIEQKNLIPEDHEFKKLESKKDYSSNGELTLLMGTDGKNDNESVILDNVHAKWLHNNHFDTLTGINMYIKSGELVGIIGNVGSGKSSLLHVILKELPITHGQITVPNKISYASQEPWLFSGTVRQNILFGNPMDYKKYHQVIQVCQLTRDFELLPHGDRTIIGEDGISLSGGQRARINLARAVYTDVSLYLFDDPLSSVDIHVSKRIFHDCIENYLKERTRIIITQQIQFLRNVDKIIVLNNGKIIGTGTYENLIKMGINIGDKSVEDCEDDSTDEKSIVSKCCSDKHDNIESLDSFLLNNIKNEKKINPKCNEETRTKGKISTSTWLSYLNAGGNYWIIFIVILPYIAAQLSSSGLDWFLSYWIKIEEINNKLALNNSSIVVNNTTVTVSPDAFDTMLSRNTCLYIYSGLIVITIIVSITRLFVFYEVCIRASKRLHNALFNSISHAKMFFFTTNTSGRILNRFSKDLGLIDELLPVTFIECIQIASGVLGTIVVITISNPYLLIPTIIMSITYYLLRVFYVATSRSVKRLEGVARSPIYNHFCATLKGLTTIRSFDANEILIEEFDRHQDLHSSAWYIYISSTRAFIFWLYSVYFIYIATVIMSFLNLSEDSQFKQGANVGLAITQCIGITGKLQYGMKQSAELENQMTSVERVREYTNIESEPSLKSQLDKVSPSDWPCRAEIKFKNVALSYGPKLPIVLNHINLTIKSHEHVGIVGRTGAGKSSIIAALFRLANYEGSIEIDGVDIKEIGIHDCRSKITIIPQKPFLFSGTLRNNLDPLEEYDDAILWAALKDVELTEIGLDFIINDCGCNLSMGQRQLVCLARAIVKKNKILILDEATANIDSHTDQVVQKTIRQKFFNCTLIIIAHELNNVMNCDKILVMDAGNIAEFDHPHILLQNPNGYLSSMVKETGNSMAKHLAAVAKENYEQYRTSTV